MEIKNKVWQPEFHLNYAYFSMYFYRKSESCDF